MYFAFSADWSHHWLSSHLLLPRGTVQTSLVASHFPQAIALRGHSSSYTTSGKMVAISHVCLSHTSFFFFFCLSVFLGPLPPAYGGSQPRGPIRAVATGLHHSHRNMGSLTPERGWDQSCILMDASQVS